MPNRVRVTSHVRATSTTGPTAIRNRSYCGNRAAQDLDRAGEARRARPEQVLGAERGEDRVAHDEHDGEGGGELQELGRGIQALQQQPLDQRADERHGKRGQQHARPERQRAAAEDAGDEVAERVGAIRAEHVQRAVREVHDARHAEDEREPGRDQEQRGGAGQAVQELQQEGGERHARGGHGAAALGSAHGGAILTRARHRAGAPGAVTCRQRAVQRCGRSVRTTSSVGW